MSDWHRILTEQARTLSTEALARHLTNGDLSRAGREVLEAELATRAVSRATA